MSTNIAEKSLKRIKAQAHRRSYLEDISPTIAKELRAKLGKSYSQLDTLVRKADSLSRELQEVIPDYFDYDVRNTEDFVLSWDFLAELLKKGGSLLERQLAALVSEIQAILASSR